MGASGDQVFTAHTRDARGSGNLTQQPLRTLSERFGLSQQQALECGRVFLANGLFAEVSQITMGGSFQTPAKSRFAFPVNAFT